MLCGKSMASNFQPGNDPTITHISRERRLRAAAICSSVSSSYCTLFTFFITSVEGRKSDQLGCDGDYNRRLDSIWQGAMHEACHQGRGPCCCGSRRGSPGSPGRKWSCTAITAGARDRKVLIAHCATHSMASIGSTYPPRLMRRPTICSTAPSTSTAAAPRT